MPASEKTVCAGLRALLDFQVATGGLIAVS
jgi:hypothetical protein